MYDRSDGPTQNIEAFAFNKDENREARRLGIKLRISSLSSVVATKKQSFQIFDKMYSCLKGHSA